MAGGKKKVNRHTPSRNDSTRADIEAAQRAGAVGEDDEGFDIAADLLATLDARDAAADALSSSTATPIAPPVQPTASTDSAASQATSASSSSTMSAGGSTMASLKEAGGRLLGRPGSSPGSSTKSPPTSNATLGLPASTEDVSEPGRRRSIGKSAGQGIKKLFGHSPTAADTHDANVQQTSGAIMGPKIGRQKARLARRDAEQAALRAQAELELKVNGGKPDEAERERAGMADLCSSLGREMVEINPDGHCLYAAVADQLHTLGKVHKKVDFRDTRKATAEHMRANATEFIPFISDSDEHMAGITNDSAGTQGQDVEQRARKHFLDYCDAVENTGVWGGQPEILALSRAYKTQIHVVQVGSPTLKVGEGEHKGEPCVISYHRKMYGLGEHYNSLRKVKK
ncbi:cysteine proteinase [Ceraceosorus guamensis]|uniref:Cysteine proteinase n=1 Tax=Ceraceosorus guamensis TaxID=1522189 RepID=A0A316W045_9BASI|nr:cysteine proteinase [Ceraceosorus guamensis]PWN41921.1 cysteine proteinase [Ceraceosorus guamensis]